MLNTGSVAPDFQLAVAGSAKESISLADFKGKNNVLLVFYPKDKTPGCTRQLCAVRDDHEKFRAKDTVCFGINPGSADSHKSFIEMHGFPFAIFVDADRDVAKKYQALKENGVSIERTVYVIDKTGKIIFAEQGMPSDEKILQAII